jgi:NTE family protein
VEPTARAALALGGGGARGYAHIGVIQVLAERGVEIVAVAGTSMGAVIGALHATGKLDAYTEWVTELNELDVVRMLDVSITAPGMIRADKVFARMRELIGDARIEDLPIPFTAVATDLLARKAVWFQQGPVEAAVRASVAIPGVFTPLMMNGRVLVDGGLMEPVPVAPTAAAPADVIVAVNLGGERSGVSADAPARETADARPVDEWIERFRRRASSLMDRDIVASVVRRLEAVTPGRDRGDDPGREPYPVGLSRFDVMNQSLEVMQSLVTRYRLAGAPPDVLVTVPKDACRTLDFHRARDMIALGRELAVDALDDAGVGS